MPKIVIKKGDFVVNKLSIPEEILAFTIGSEQGNDIIIADESISSYHLQFEKQNNKYYIRDLQSQNGTFVNGVRITARTLLNTNDQIEIGNHKITLLFSEPLPQVPLYFKKNESDQGTSDSHFEDKIAGVPSLTQLNAWLNDANNDQDDIFNDHGGNGNSKPVNPFDEIDPENSPDFFDDNQNTELGPSTTFITSENDKNENHDLNIETETLLKPEKTDSAIPEFSEPVYEISEPQKPDTSVRYYLLGIYGYYLGRKFKLRSSRTKIGRNSKENHIILRRNSKRRRDKGVSRQHATITNKEDRYYIRDKKSTWGLRVNRKKVEPSKKVYLDPGDEIEFLTDSRSHIFRFVIEGDWDFSSPKKAGAWHIRNSSTIITVLSAIVILIAGFLLANSFRTTGNMDRNPVSLSAKESFWCRGLDNPDLPKDRLVFSTYPAMADLNGDSFIDVVFIDTSGILKSINGATKKPLWVNREFETNFNERITLEDLNNDNNPDVIVQSKDSRVRVISGANGREILRSPVLENPLTGAPIVGDFNGDGFKDLAVTAGNNSVYIGFLSSSKPNWTRLEIQDSIRSFAAAEDVTGDKVHDILIGTETGKIIIIDGTVPEVLGAIDINEELSKALGSFNLSTQIRFPASFADLNGDNSNDIIVSTEQGYIIAINGKTHERLWWDEADAESQSTGTGKQSISLGDFDGDGLLDVANVTLVGRLRVILGRDMGKDRKSVLWEYPSAAPGEFIGPAAIADFNKNGIMDIVIAGQNGFIYIFEGSTGEILWKSADNAEDLISPPLIGDLDNDGYLDILAYRADGNFYKISTNSPTVGNTLPWGQTFGNSGHTSAATFFQPNHATSNLLIITLISIIFGTIGLNLFLRKKRSDLRKNHQMGI